ncbi:10737_t:CDS:2, partial [Scutellospora calospora]
SNDHTQPSKKPTDSSSLHSSIPKAKPKIVHPILTSQSFLPPTISPTYISNSTTSSDLSHNPPAIIGIIISSIIAIIVLVLIIKKTTFGKISIEKRQFSLGLGANNDPSFDLNDFQQNQELTSKFFKKFELFDTFKWWIANIFNRGNRKFRLNSLIISNNIVIINNHDMKNSNFVNIEDETFDYGVGVSSISETEISFPDILPHALNWEEYIL